MSMTPSASDTVTRNPAAPAVRRQSRPAILQAMARTSHGRLAMTTPEGDLLEFGIGKDGPQADMQIHDWKTLDELVVRGDIGLAEAYMDKLWDSSDLAEVIAFGLANGTTLERYFHGRPWHALWLRVKYWMHGNSVKGSRKNIMSHYDLGNAFYALWLDRSMTYSGAFFDGNPGRTLEEAQQAKYHRLLSKLGLPPGSHILELGCGWGGFAEAAAKQGYRVTGVTISKEQGDFARDRLKQAGLDNLADVELRDYRETSGTYDGVVSIGMFEHVGQEYWPAYFNTVRDRLKPGGKAMIQCITLDDALFERLHGVTGFIEHYIFPGGLLPSRSRFKEAAEKAGLKSLEQFAFGQDYARTLREWRRRFEAHLPEVRALGFDETFIRLWRFYLSICIASFETGRTSLMQAELVKVSDDGMIR
jgi:cyclopropane-fatty-acyl-phospholipid synthase